uniref:Farinin protein n=1 Tax=Brachypodium distachyon TaxID=15368 RepID=W8Q666_BRADI|nr:farinin protein [Brachypodium distachyon]
MKTMFILALLAHAASTATAQLETICSQGFGQCQHHQQVGQQQLLDQMKPCVAFVQHQCRPVRTPFSQTRGEQHSSCQTVQHQCCRQPVQIPEQARCKAIQSVEEAISQQQPQQEWNEPQQEAQLKSMRMSLQTLPSMCNIYVPVQCQQQHQLGRQQQQQLQEQLKPCATFLQHQCRPMTVPFPHTPVHRPTSCQSVQAQCCRQLAQIPEKFRCQAIHNVVESIRQQQHHQPQQEVQLEDLRMSLHTLPSMCKIYIPVQCPATTTTPHSITMTASYTDGTC